MKVCVISALEIETFDI